MQLTVVSLKTGTLVYLFKSVQAFYMILTGSDVIIRIIMSWMTSLLCNAIDSRRIAGNG